MTVNELADFMWRERQKIHGHYPDDGPLNEQPEMIQDWQRQEAAAVHALVESWAP